jgi:hypothetical protein
MDKMLEISIDALSAIANRLGIVDAFSPADSKLLRGFEQKYKIPLDLVTWYSKAEPFRFEIPRPAENLSFRRLQEFDDALLGYAFIYKEGTKIILDEWNPSWLVIGGEGEYPIIMQKSSENDPAIYYGQTNNTSWKLNKLSDNLSGFLSGIANYVVLYSVKYQGNIYEGDLMSEDYDLASPFVLDFSTALDENISTSGRSELWLRGWLGL